MPHVDEIALRNLLKQILDLGKGYDRVTVLVACENAIANIILEQDPSPHEASEQAIRCGTEIAAKIDRYFKNLGPRPGPAAHA